MKTRVIVCGGTEFRDRERCFGVLDRLLAGRGEVEIVSGHARGADLLGEEYAKLHGLALRVFPAEWARYGKAAGPIRNGQMIEYARGEQPLVIAFWDGQSRGTANTLARAREAGIETHVISCP